MRRSRRLSGMMAAVLLRRPEFSMLVALVAFPLILVGPAAAAVPVAAVMQAPASPVNPASTASHTGTGGAVRVALAAELDAPLTARAGRSFRVRCEGSRRLAGYRVWGYLNGNRIKATRVVANSGNCSMRLVTSRRGSTQISFRLLGNGLAYRTDTVTVVIK